MLAAYCENNLLEKQIDETTSANIMYVIILENIVYS